MLFYFLMYMYILFLYFVCRESEEHFNKEKSFQANEISDFKTK